MYEMQEIEFKIMFSRKCNVKQENTDRQLEEMRKLAGDTKEAFTKETIKDKQKEQKPCSQHSKCKESI